MLEFENYTEQERRPKLQLKGNAIQTGAIVYTAHEKKPRKYNKNNYIYHTAGERERKLHIPYKSGGKG